MLNHAAQAPRGHLSTKVAGQREQRYALLAVLVSAAVFLAALPFVRTPLAQVPAFIPIYVTALVIFDLVTAVLLFGQFSALRSPELLILAAGYLFTATVTMAYALIFPGLFAPAGLLGSGAQTSSAMFMFWHAGFPLLPIAFARSKRRHAAPGAPAHWLQGKARWPILSVIGGMLALVSAFTAVATLGHDLLPVFLRGNQTTELGRWVLIGIWLLSLLALWTLWRSKPHSVLDVWLLVVMCVWLFDLALAAVFNTGRYDLGWYAGRIYGLLAAGLLLMLLLSENTRHYARLVRLSADLGAANDKLLQLSLQDGMTGLSNRRAFDQYLAEQMAISTRHQRAMALVLLDVDHFKRYNDHHGHHAGDECLRQVGAALQRCCQRPGDMAARYGGEEFALILPDTDSTGAVHIAESARQSIARLLIAHPQCASGYLTISVGAAATMGPGPANAAQLIKAADEALYQAKQAGRNRVVLAENSPQAPASSPGVAPSVFPQPHP